jgi:hypothetical protein
VLALGAITLLGTAGPASAHSANGQPVPYASQYLTAVTGISPATPGISARVDPRGEWIEVSNTTAKTLIIEGYTREPYLRVGPAGVDANVNAPSWALNHALFGDLSQLGDSTLAPDWQHQQDDPNASWHDHRIHWMGVQRPPAVAANPTADQLIGHWTVHMTLAGSPLSVTGTLSWIGLAPARHASSTMHLLAAAAGAVALLLIAGGVLLLRRRQPDGGRTGDGTLDNELVHASGS